MLAGGGWTFVPSARPMSAFDPRLTFHGLRRRMGVTARQLACAKAGHLCHAARFAFEKRR